MTLVGQGQEPQGGVGDTDGIAVEVLQRGFPVQVEARIRVRRRYGQVGLEKGEDVGRTDAFRFTVLAEDGGVLALAGNVSRQQGVPVLRPRDGREVPAVQDVGAEFGGDPGDGAVILLPVEGTSRIEEDAARLEGRPDVRQDAPAAGRTECHRLGGPVLHGLLVLAEHALAGAGDVGDDNIEDGLPGKGRRVTGDNSHAGVAPRADIRAEHAEAVPHHFVGQEGKTVAEALPERSGEVGGLAAGGGAEVQDGHARAEAVQYRAEQSADKHGRRILHVVASGMEQRVQREVGAFLQEVAVRTPGNAFGVRERAGCQFGRVQADGDGRLAGQRVQHRPCPVGTELFRKPADERLGKHQNLN